LDNLYKLLDYYESIIDVEHFHKTIELQKKIMQFEEPEHIGMRLMYPSDTFKRYTMQEIHSDMAKMMYNELLDCLPQIEAKDSGIPMLRANFGVGALPCAFGLKSYIIENNMPWVEHVSKDEAKKILVRGVPDYTAGYGQRILEIYEFYKEVLSKYPKCNEVIKFHYPDYQGPFSTVHLILGTETYYEVYDDPDFIHELLDLSVETYLTFIRKIKPYINDEMYDGYCLHWNALYPGKILLRNDSAVNLSVDMYKEFVEPYDLKIIKALGGKASMHFCGRADHWIFELARCEDIIGLNFGHMESQVFGQDYLDFLAPEVTDKKLPIIDYFLTKKDFDSLDFKKYRTGINYKMAVSDRQEAEQVLARCHTL